MTATTRSDRKRVRPRAAARKLAMTYPTLTALYAAGFALIFFVLSIWVVAGRATSRVWQGDGGEARLNQRIRAHANFAEYVPLTLLLVGLIEAGGAGRGTVHALLAPLFVARLLHPIGMTAEDNSVSQRMLRGLPATVTWLVLLAAAILLLIRIA
jgi:uncharacterized membrane protein YecN with MAPEG domain